MYYKKFCVTFLALFMVALTSFGLPSINTVQAQRSDPACNNATIQLVDPDSYRWGTPWPWGPPGNWQITFSDEFNRNKLGCKWNDQWGLPGQYWSPNKVSWSSEVMYPWNVYLNGQQLLIQHIVLNKGTSTTADDEITAGVVTTRGVFAQKYGYFEAKMQMCGYPGVLNAFWMQYNPDSWPPEIDVIEVLGNQPTTPYTTIHYGPAFPNNLSAGYHRNTGVNYTTGYHYYGVEWNPQQLIFYIDGQEYWRVANPGGNFNKEMYLQFNIHSGNSWSGYPPAGVQQSCFMHVDYVRVYKRV